MPTYIKTGFWEKARKGYKEWLNLDQLITNIVTPLIPPTSTYKVYTAFLTQSGTNAPVATVLENTIGDISFEYINIGAYTISSNNLFTEDKTIVLQDQQINRNDIDIDYCIRIVYDDVNSIIINTAFLDTSETNDALLNTPIEIRVYN